MKVRYRKTSFALSLLITDIFLMLASLKAAFWIRFKSGFFSTPLGIPDYHVYAQTFSLIVILMVIFFKVFGLYKEEKIIVFTDEVAMILKAVTTTMLIFLVFSFFYRDFSFSRSYLITAWVLIPCVITLSRSTLGYAYAYYRRNSGKFSEIILAGASHDAARFGIRVKREPRFCAKVIGIFDDGYTKDQYYKGIPVLGKISDIPDYLQKNENVNELVVTADNLDHKRIMELMTLCDKYLVVFKWAADILDFMATRMIVRYEMGLPLLSHREPPMMEWENRVLKRTADIILTAFGLILLMPFLLAVAVIVKLDSKGPVFYKQDRVGEDGKVFHIYKFRTMKTDAEAETGPVWAREHDDRRTRIGGFLRKFNIDELPQLWNVLRGDMSLVGPRPERPHFVGQFKEDIPKYMVRHRIKSGLTGWAQVHGLRGNTSIQERTKYDLYYIENWSVLLDIKILFMTVFAFKNAY